MDGGTSPAIKGDGKLSEINTFLLEKLYNFSNHASEDLWFGCVSSTLLAYRSDVYGDYPIAYIDSYDNDVLTLYRFLMSTGIPVICKFVLWLSRRTDDLSKPVYNCIIDTDCDFQSGESGRTFRDIFSY